MLTAIQQVPQPPRVIENPGFAATEEAVQSEVLQIRQAISLAIENDPVFQQITWQIEKAKGDRLQATRIPNPVTGLSADEIGNDGSGGQYGVFWSQNIVRNNSRTIQHRYFSLEIARLQRRYDIRRWQLVRSIAERFLRVSRVQREQVTTAQQISSMSEIQNITRRLFDAGEVPQTTVTNIELELDTLNQKLVELNLQLEYERRALAVPLGLSGMGGAADGTGKLPDIEFGWAKTIDVLVQRTQTAMDSAWLDSHPQINFAQAESQQAKWQIELARSERCPDVQLQGSLTYDTATDDVFAGVQVGVPWLRNNNHRGAIGAATAGYQKSLEAVRLIEIELHSKYAVASGELERLKSRVTNFRNVIIPKAAENRAQIQSAFTVGEAGFLLVKSGFERELKARLDLIQAEFDLAVAETRLRTLLVDQ